MPLAKDRFAAFMGHHRIAHGSLVEVALAVHRLQADDPNATVLIFADGNGGHLDLDLRGTAGEVRARVSAAMEAEQSDGADAAQELAPPRGRGRPRLGVVAKEVTLLPRHWAWLAGQRGGASATLRRLVEQARRSGERQEAVRRSQDAAFRFMSALGGDLAGYEEAIRSLYASDGEGLRNHIEGWPADVREHALLLAEDALREPSRGGDAEQEV